MQAKKGLVEGMKAASREIFGRNATAFFEKKTRELINEKSFKLASNGTKRVDIVKDVINTLPALWISYVNIVSRITIINKRANDTEHHNLIR